MRHSDGLGKMPLHLALDIGASDEIVQLVCCPEVMIRYIVGVRLQIVCVWRILR